jgi:general secretion pathway protein C
MAARWTAWWVWAALAGSLVFWGLRLFARPAPVPAQIQTVGIDQAVRGDVLRLLGAVAPAGEPAAPPPPAAARFKLVGAVASTGAGASWAVLSVDDQPARVVRQGGAVDGQWVLQAVTAKGVRLGPSGAAAQLTLDLPQLPPPATGTLAGPAVAGGVRVPGTTVGLPAAAGQVPLPGQMAPQMQQPVQQMQPPLQPPLQQEQPMPDRAGSVTGGVVDPNLSR